MIKVIERNIRYGSQRVKRYRVTCYRCKSVFECDSTDLHSVAVDQGITDDGVRCPVCGRECTGWYETDSFVELVD